jgi:head-tail adaptor
MNKMHSITFLENIVSREERNEDWQVKMYSFAKVVPLCDNRFLTLEGLNFGNIMSEEYFIFQMRFLKEVRMDMRISYDSHLFEIKRLLNVDGLSRKLHIIALVIN